jgi:imidazolonepropionase-like amidohydrolase
MNRHFLCAACAFASIGVTPVKAAESTEQWTFVQAGTLITRPDEPPRKQVTLIARKGKIIDIREGYLDAADYASAANAKVVIQDLRRRTVLPGLIDTHVHFEIDPADKPEAYAIETESYFALRGASYALRTLKAGFTTVRDLGSLPQDLFALRKAIADGHLPGPRIIAAGAPMSIIGGHGDLSTGFRPEVASVLSTFSLLCTGPEECSTRVREASRAGADVIKVLATGGILSQQSRGLGSHFAPDELQAISKTAHSLGMKVAAHAHSAEGIAAAAQTGADSIEHGTFADAAAIRAMKANGTYLVPTLMVFSAMKANLGTGTYSAIVEAKARTVTGEAGKAVSLARKAGVPIAFGTDAGVYAHGRNAEEFGLLVRQGGLSPREALMTATVNAAKLLGYENELGCLRVGCRAELIAVDGDPLADPDILTKVEFVMTENFVWSRAGVTP